MNLIRTVGRRRLGWAAAAAQLSAMGASAAAGPQKGPSSYDAMPVQIKVNPRGVCERFSEAEIPPTAHAIAADRPSTRGCGKTMPMTSDDDDAGCAKNRRVEIARPDGTQ